MRWWQWLLSGYGEVAAMMALRQQQLVTQNWPLFEHETTGQKIRRNVALYGTSAGWLPFALAEGLQQVWRDLNPTNPVWTPQITPQEQETSE